MWNDNMQQQRLLRRAGVTLMETIFAIGVILVGLLGLAALIPIAADNAKSTLQLDQSVSDATSVAAAGVARDLFSLDTLVIYDKRSPPAFLPAFAYPPHGLAPSSQLQTLRWKLTEQSQHTRPLLDNSSPEEFYGKLESPGYRHHGQGSGLTSGICIDPYGLPAPSLIGGTIAGGLPDPNVGTPCAFDYSRFPYFTERYNPLFPPNEEITTSTVPPAWPMSPRMYRATLASTLQNDAITPVTERELVARATLERIFEGLAGLSQLKGQESDDPGAVLLSRTRVGTNFIDTGRSSSSEYKWFVTLAPPINGGNTFRQSIVVVRDRLPQIPRQAGDPNGLNTEAHTVGQAEDNPAEERLTWIGQSIGFTGGAGGEVLMYGTQGVINELKTNEWVMLSRQPSIGTTPTGPAVHRWYRVLSVSDAEVGSIAPPPPATPPAGSLVEPNWIDGTTPAVWRRWVTLAGPDWDFGLSDNNSSDANTQANDTFCTIVDGAVSVLQSEVVLE